MTLIKGKQEFRTILDFKSKLSKNKIRQALRDVEVFEMTELPDSECYTFIENHITVGMYRIRLSFSSLDATLSRKRLRDYGGLRVAVYESSQRGKSKFNTNINLARDRRFTNQYWTQLNPDFKVRMKDLANIIIHLQRLNNLKMFL